MSPDGTLIARLNGTVQGRDGRARNFPVHRNVFAALDFSRDGTLLASGSTDDTVRLWRLPEGGEGRLVGWHQEGVNAVGISPDNHFVATGQLGGSLVRIWRVAEPPAGRRITGFRDSRIRLSRDGRLLAPSGRTDFGSHIPRTRVYAVETGEPVGPELTPGGAILDADFAADTAWLALVCGTTKELQRELPDTPRSGTLELWDFRAGTRLGESIIFPTEPRAVCVHPDGKKLAVYGAMGGLYEVDVATREIRHLSAPDLQTPGDAHAACRYSPDGRVLVAWGLGRPPIVWEEAAQKLSNPPEWAQSGVMDLDFHGDVAGSGSMESSMRFLTLPGDHPAAPRIQDTNWIFVTRFSSEGDLFLTGGRGRIGHVWDWRKGTLNCPALPHDGEIFGGRLSARHGICRHQRAGSGHPFLGPPHGRAYAPADPPGRRHPQPHRHRERPHPRFRWQRRQRHPLSTTWRRSCRVPPSRQKTRCSSPRSTPPPRSNADPSSR